MPKILYPNSIRIGLMDPSIAQIWAQRILSDGTTVGSIKKGDTINHTTSQPIATGLFCQRIFGPCIDYTCACGHEKIRIGFNPNVAPPVCSECHVEWTHASVRRQFLGSIDLISPVTHKWFSDSRGAYIPTLLGISPRTFRNLKECKLFFPFGLKEGQKLMEYPKEKQVKDNNAAKLVPRIIQKKATSVFRAMHSLQFLIDPKKSLNPQFLQNLQLTTNLRGLWFLSDNLGDFDNILREKKVAKFSELCRLTGATDFCSVPLVPSVRKETSYKNSLTNKIFGKDIFFQNLETFSTKVFSNLQSKTEKFLIEKDPCVKEQNFLSLITAAQWLISEHAFSVNQKTIHFMAQRVSEAPNSQQKKKPIYNVFLSKQKSVADFYKFEQETPNPLRLDFLAEQLKNKDLDFRVGDNVSNRPGEIALQANSMNSKVVQNGRSQEQEIYPGLFKPTFEANVTLPIQELSSQNLNKLTERKSLSFKNPDIIFDWKAKSLLSETNLKSKTITDLAALISRKSEQNSFFKKANLKYVFLLAQKMENTNLSVFSKRFSILALQNKQISMKTLLEVNMRLNQKNKKSFLASFFADVKKKKRHGNTRTSKLQINPVSLVAKNATYIFRDFTKYKLKEIPEILFGKNQQTTQLFLNYNTNTTKFGSRIKKFRTINNYKIGHLANSHIGLFLTLSPFTINFLLPQKKMGSLWPKEPTQGLLKKLYQQSTPNWLVSQNQEKFISCLHCSHLLRLTGTKLWYLQEQETFANFLLKTHLSKFKKIKQRVQGNPVEIGLNSKNMDFGSFNFKASYPRAISLINFFSNKPLKQPYRHKFSAPQLGLQISNSFTKNHTLPIRPSYTQPEDFRRQFIKFLGINSLIQSTDRPVFSYTNKSELTHKEPILKSRVKKSFAQKYKDSFLSPQAIEIYFSEAKSVAKEQTIKKILSQTGGGGLQDFLELVNLSELVLILQNDLWEIAPRLAKSQFTRRILLSIINDASNSLTETLFLLRKSANKQTLVVASGKQKQLSNSNPLFNKEQQQNSIEPFSLNFVGLQDKEKNVPVKSQIILEKNNLLLSEKVDTLEKKCKDVKKEYKAVKKICSDFQNRKNAHKRRYKLAFQLLRTMSNPAGMTMSSVPVLPPGLRPIIDVPKIGPITADLNIRYRSLLFALRNLRELAYVDFRNAGAAQASVQEAVDDLLYTGGKSRREKTSSQNPNLYKSLAMRLKGKHGRFRGNLLGKRVDYSGRSVIVVGPTLKIHQCGLPFEIAIKLFNPFLIRSLIQRGFCKNVYKAKQILIRGKFKPLIWTLCQEVMSEHLVLLNRAPTLHRLGVQAFMPVLISGRAILLHPLVCTGFNADFDGDQMGVHVPLFPQARAEAWKMMWSRNNFLLPSSGEPVLLPSQDMVLGCYYLTCSTQKVVQTTLETTTSNNNDSFPFTVLNKKTALTRYKKGTYNIQSSVWINTHKTTFLKSGRIYDRYQKKFSFPNPLNYQIQRIEDDGIVTPTLELRITPFGVLRLLSTGGLKSITFQNSLLLPGPQSLKPPIFAFFVRTTIGRLIFNNLLEDLGSS